MNFNDGIIRFDSSVEIIGWQDQKIVDRVTIKNTTLKIGRRSIAAALGGNLLSSTFDSNVTTLAWGTNGVDGGGNIIPVPETATGFVNGGTVYDQTAVVASMVSGDEATVIFSSALGTSASSNGQKISQIGLKMASGDYWAITTWTGFDKNGSTSFSINWSVYFL